MNTRLIYSIIIYLLIIILIIVNKPKPFFDSNKIYKNVKEFGTGENKTIFSLGVFTVLIAFLSYYFISLIDVVFKRTEQFSAE